MMPRQAIAVEGLSRNRQAPLLDAPAGLPGHIDAFACRYGRAPNIAAAKRELQRAGVSTPIPIEIWWTPTHYGDASADEYAEMKRGLERGGVFKVTLKSSEWAQYSGVLGTQYNAFQLGWFPDYPDPENYVLVVLPVRKLHRERLREPEDDPAAQPGAGSHHCSETARHHPADPDTAANDVPIIPYWQGNMIAVGRSNVRGIPSTLDAAVIMRYWKISKS